MSTIPLRRRNSSAHSAEQNNPPKAVRCAIYTRKSTEEGLKQEFNSLDAQRDACENYIKAQVGEGWVCLPTHYDDGGYTGGNMDRPGLTQLMEDIDAGKIDCVVVYKVDRLSRSLMDFSRIMERFDKRTVSFVSVTQHFNTTSSMGRLTLNILLSFAQFEREIISERTRDKMAAARRKGKWSGGTPPLGYDVVASKLIVNEDEAACVRQIFELYLEKRSLLEVVKELQRRGWTTKRWTTREGKTRGGIPFEKNNLYYLLRNVVSIGKVEYEGQTFAGEHTAIIDQELFDKVQNLLISQGQSGGKGTRSKGGGVLSGLIRCQTCQCAMTHTYTARGVKRYRYYVCQNAMKRGYEACPSPSIPAEEIERFVVDQIRVIGEDPSLLAASVAEISSGAQLETHALDQEARLLTGQVHAAYGELSQLAIQPGAEDRMATIQTEIDRYQRRLSEIRQNLDHLTASQIQPDEVAAAFARFDPLWNAMSLQEQNDLLRLLIERVDFDGPSGEVQLQLHQDGIQALMDQNRNTP